MSRVIALLLVFAAVFFIGCVLEEAGPKNAGMVYFSITDKKLDIANVTSVEVTISEIQVHMTATETQTNESEIQINETEANGTETNNNETETNEEAGWITVLNESKTYDLLALTNLEKLLTSADMEAGSYNIIRLRISNVSVVLNGQAQEAKLPSSKIDIKVHFTVTANSTSLVSLDFNLNDSLHITGDGRIIMAPVIKVEVDREVEIEIKDGEVKKSGGEKETETEVGMDERGNVSEGRRIAPDANVSIADNGEIQVTEQGETQPQQHDVSARVTGFSPSSLTIAKGDTVRWVFRDPYPQRLVSTDAGFDSYARYEDTIWSNTFNETGTFTYSDSLRPSLTGTITVE